MTAKYFVRQWLNQHRGLTFEDATPEEQAHFELILSDVCEAYLENERKEIVNDHIEKCIDVVFWLYAKKEIAGSLSMVVAEMRKNKIQ